MAIPTSKPLSLSAVQTEFGGSNPISMSEYRGKGRAPATGAIDLWADFNGVSSSVTLDTLFNFDNAVEVTRGSGQSPYNNPTTGAIVNDPTAVAYFSSPSLDGAQTTYSKHHASKLRIANQPWVGATITNITKAFVRFRISANSQDAGILGSADSRHCVAFGSSSSFGGYYVNTKQLIDHTGGELASFPAGDTGDVGYDVTAALSASELTAWVANGCPLWLGCAGERIEADPYVADADGGRVLNIDIDLAFTYE
jgi:hypothetical protein